MTAITLVLPTESEMSQLTSSSFIVIEAMGFFSASLTTVLGFWLLGKKLGIVVNFFRNS